jgi:hypothetical protein
MANNALGQGLIYPWNPFNDLTTNRIENELVHVEPNPAGVIVLPRKGPFFAREFSIRLRDSGRELSLVAGDYSFVYPFGAFIRNYSNLVYGGLMVNNVTDITNLEITYNTIGDRFVLDDIAYAQAVANVLTQPRRADWSQITNLPEAFPPPPHDHPASDTYNYEDMIVALHSYIDVMAGGTSNPDSLQARLENHIKADLKDAHSASLTSLGIKNLKDWAMAEEPDLMGNSTELLMNVATTKILIRGFMQGVYN